jgi:hypothetical protein
MSVPKSLETRIFLSYSDLLKSNYYSNNSNSTSGSFEITNNNGSRIIKKINSNSKNKRKQTKNCKHKYNLLAKFYQSENKNNEKEFSKIKITENLNNEKNKNYDKTFRKICFCNKCSGLIVKMNKKIPNTKNKLLTVACLPSETMKSYLNPIELFFNMRRTDANISLIFINNYSKKRKDMISFIAKLRNKYKLSLDSFYLAIALLDNVCAKMVKFNVDIELLTIGCFFLAGIFSKFNFKC